MRRSDRRRLWGGALVGAANGLFGGGGGMIAVPLLERAGLPKKRAHATAIAVVVPACVTSAAVYLGFGLIPPALAVPVALGVVAGGLLGAHLLPRIPARLLDLIFSAAALLSGARMLFS